MCGSEFRTFSKGDEHTLAIWKRKENIWPSKRKWCVEDAYQSRVDDYA